LGSRERPAGCGFCPYWQSKPLHVTGTRPAVKQPAICQRLRTQIRLSATGSTTVCAGEVVGSPPSTTVCDTRVATLLRRRWAGACAEMV
jgi:hypothetical protein